MSIAIDIFIYSYEYLLSIGHDLFPIAHDLFPITHYPLPTNSYLLPIQMTYHLLATRTSECFCMTIE